MNRLLTRLAAAILLLHCLPARATPPTGFGNQWVRDHPFTLMGLNIFAANLEVEEYVGAGFNTLLAWEETEQQAGIAAAGGLTWHAHIRPAHQGPDAYLQNLVRRAAAKAGGLGWLLHDEPSYLQMSGIGDAAVWIRQSYPGMPVYCNAFPSYASAALLYGDSSHPGYGYGAYLDDFVAIIAPDILMYDHYPFEADGETTSGFYSDLMTVRAKALAAGIPYWAFVQSWASGGSRLPSESDLRMHIYTHLAAGYSGLAYFTYDHWEEGGLLDAAGAPTPLYDIAGDVNAEVLRLGEPLRYLTSTDVRYLAGEFMLLGLWLTENPVPSGMTPWQPMAGGDPHIIAADIDTSNSANYGLGKDGVMGFFTDDSGRHYFMLVNVWHAANRSAAAASLPFLVEFDASIDTLLELDPETGQQVVVPLNNHRLELTLAGGSGRLFKYDDGPFAPAPGPGPDGGGDRDGGADTADGASAADGGDADVEITPMQDGASGADPHGGDQSALPADRAALDEAGGGCACRGATAGPSCQLLFLLFAGWWMRRPSWRCKRALGTRQRRARSRARPAG